ncbi:hypothetical protein [Palleronia marisminoris]|uniref:hypothetical protein n=1 Tax=Palleronia marisminoris TaxID=315423 RepID=UPI001113D3B5|nr:hypothetical protein [Palleronia marisminoris]
MSVVIPDCSQRRSATNLAKIRPGEQPLVALGRTIFENEDEARKFAGGEPGQIGLAYARGKQVVANGGPELVARHRDCGLLRREDEDECGGKNYPERYHGASLCGFAAATIDSVPQPLRKGDDVHYHAHADVRFGRAKVGAA